VDCEHRKESSRDCREAGKTGEEDDSDASGSKLVLIEGHVRSFFISASEIARRRKQVFKDYKMFAARRGGSL
jgi:hypothetical protein